MGMPLPSLSLWPGRQQYRPCLVGGRRGGGPSSCRDDITKELERADFLELFCMHLDLYFHNVAPANHDTAPLCALFSSLVTSWELGGLSQFLSSDRCCLQKGGLGLL